MIASRSWLWGSVLLPVLFLGLQRFARAVRSLHHPTSIATGGVQLTLVQLLRWSLQSLMHGRGTEMPCAAFYQRRRNTNSKLLLTTFSKTICDRKRCLKYVVVGNPRLKDGNWLNQRLTNWIRKCAKVDKRDEWYTMLSHYNVCWLMFVSLWDDVNRLFYSLKNFSWDRTSWRKTKNGVHVANI